MNLLEAYRYLGALAEHRHFGRAAQACHITQPALSNALRALEQHLGVAIVRRGRQFEGLTAEGELVLATAHRVLHEQESLQQELHGGRGQARGRLVIGSVPTAVPMAARFAARLVGQHPSLCPQVRSLSSQEIETGLETLAIDLGLGYLDRIEGRLGSRLNPWPQYVERYFVVRQVAPVGPGGLHFGAPIAWADAAALPLCLLAPEMHNRAVIDAAMREAGCHVQPVIETNSVSALLAVVQAGSVQAVLPGALVSMVLQHGGLEALPLVAPAVGTPIGFMTSALSRPSRALQAALVLAQDADWLAQAARGSGMLDRDGSPPRTG